MFSFRATKQREIKKTTSDANVSNTANASNNSSDTGNGANTTHTVNIPVTAPVTESDAIGSSSALNTNHTHSAVKESKPVVKMEVTECKEQKQEGLKTEGLKSEGPKNEVLEKKVPITPKGKYELRASTLVPRDYGMRDEDDESGENKKVEAVIDLTDDDDIAVTKEKPKATNASGILT